MAKKRSYKEAEKALNSLRDQSDSLARQYDKNFDNILSSTSQVADAQELINDLAREHNKLLKEGKTEYAASAKYEHDSVKELQEKSKLLNETKTGYSQINDQIQDIAKNLQGMVEKLPAGKTLSKLFGVDKLSEGVEAALNKSATAFMASGNSISAATSAFTGGLMNALGPIGLIAIAVAGLVTAFLDFEKKAKSVAEATGLTLQQSKALVNEAKLAASSFDVQLSTSKDILAVQQATIKEFGVANMLTATQAANVSEIGKAFSIGAGNAAAVTNEFIRMGMSGEAAADSLLQVSAESLKAGVSVGAVTADIAANAKDVAKFFGGNVKSLQKAAVQAAKLGISLKTMASASESLLDFENSISSQFELQALTGKMINLDAARELALRGDIAGATKSVLDQVGSIAEFDNMSFLARKKLAEATGMSVDELQKSLTIQSKLGNLSADQQAAMANMGLSAAQIKNMSAEELKTKLAQQQATDKLAAGFAALKNDLTSALIPAGEALVEVFSALSPILKVLGVAIKIALSPLTMAVKAIRSIHDLISASIPATITLATVFATLLGLQNKSLVVEKAKAAVTSLKLAKETAYQGILKATAAIQSKGFFKTLASAAMTAFQSAAKIPIIGPALGATAAAGAVSLGMGYFKKTGDLGIDPNGGPIVASPREGGIFQGTRNDGVSMSPSHGMPSQATTNNTNPVNTSNAGIASVASAIAKTNALLQQILDTGTTIEMDGQVVGATLRTSDSFRRR